ncbi:MAG: hypothetical protein HUJ66_08510 [Oscillospiraceae bacterium]|nr:hypothetical protein [Oscillospiraceae bacterium]
MQFLNALLGRIKLIILWVVRILFAPDHFHQSVFTRIRYAVCGGYMPDQVMLYDFKHNDPGEYLSEFDWYRSRSINGHYSHMLNNKVVFAEMVRQFCPTPEIYAVKKDERLAGMHGRKIDTYQDILSLLREVGCFVVKPVNIGKGIGIRIVKLTDEGILHNGEPMSETELLQALKGTKNWHIVAYARQADYLNRIYAPSANTVRMIVLRSAQTGEFELSFAVQRIGAGWTGSVDNGSRGGLIAMVNVETGELSEARTLHDLRVYEKHPDTGSPIKGIIIPGWESIREGVLSVSANFPYLDIIAWDILPTNEGFTVIEANTSSGVNIIQLWGPQRYGRLGEFYREHGVIK